MKFKHRYSAGLAAIFLVLPAAADNTIYSNLQDITIPANYDGVYLDINNIAGGFVITPNDSDTIHWDMNPFYGGSVVATSRSFQPVRSADSSSAAIVNLADGTTIGSGSLFTTDFGGVGYGISDQIHMGSIQDGKFAAGTEGYLGFKVDANNNPGNPLWTYGWMRVVFTNDAGGALVKDWAYDSSGASMVVGRVLENGVNTGNNLVTLSPQGGETFTLGSVLANASGKSNSVLKTGTGTTLLSATNTYTGTTTVNGGTLGLDYSTNNTSKLADSAALILAGGTLSLTGGSHVEIVGSTNLGGGHSNITRASGATVVRMNAITPGTGLVNFGAASIASTTTSNDATGILGAWATVGGGDWAVRSSDVESGSNNYISAYSGYTDINARGGSTIPNDVSLNLRLSGDGTSGNIELGASMTTVNTILQNNANYAATVSTAGKTLLTSGIMIGAGKEALTLGAAANDGTLKAATSGGSLVLNNYNTGKTLTVNAAIANNTTACSLVTSGQVTLNGTNTYTGHTYVNAGTLALGAAGSIANSPVIDVRTGAMLDVNALGEWTVGGNAGSPQTLTGSGGVTGNTLIGPYGTHNAGDGGVGSQAISGSLNYANGSIFEWDLSSNSTTTGFDTVSATGNIDVDTTDTVFKVIFGRGVDWTNTFWCTPGITQTWSMASIFGQALNSGCFQSVQTSDDIRRYGSFSISGSSLVFTAVPEPSSALAGLLLGAGLLRRRR